MKQFGIITNFMGVIIACFGVIISGSDFFGIIYTGSDCYG